MGGCDPDGINFGQQCPSAAVGGAAAGIDDYPPHLDMFDRPVIKAWAAGGRKMLRRLRMLRSVKLDCVLHADVMPGGPPSPRHKKHNTYIIGDIAYNTQYLSMPALHDSLLNLRQNVAFHNTP
jgi:hypothetical protein